MSFSYNITFIIDPKNEAKFLSFVRDSLLAELFNPESPARNAALRKVVEAGGKKPDENHGLSIALHAEFDDDQTARKWDEVFLKPSLGSVSARFGEEILYFVTLLENLPL